MKFISSVWLCFLYLIVLFSHLTFSHLTFSPIAQASLVGTGTEQSGQQNPRVFLWERASQISNRGGREADGEVGRLDDQVLPGGTNPDTLIFLRPTVKVNIDKILTDFLKLNKSHPLYLLAQEYYSTKGVTRPVFMQLPYELDEILLTGGAYFYQYNVIGLGYMPNKLSLAMTVAHELSHVFDKATLILKDLNQPIQNKLNFNYWFIREVYNKSLAELRPNYLSCLAYANYEVPKNRKLPLARLVLRNSIGTDQDLFSCKQALMAGIDYANIIASAVPLNENLDFEELGNFIALFSLNILR